MNGDYEPSADPDVREHVELYESSGGTQGAIMDDGLPTILLTNRGAKSLKLRKTPLMRVEHEGRYAAVASQSGAAEHPFWYHNLLAHPQAEVRDGEQVFQMTARLLKGDERAQWWERAVAAFPPYQTFQERTERVIPVFLLEPAPGA